MRQLEAVVSYVFSHTTKSTLLILFFVVHYFSRLDNHATEMAIVLVICIVAIIFVLLELSNTTSYAEEYVSKKTLFYAGGAAMLGLLCMTYNSSIGDILGGYNGSPGSGIAGGEDNVIIDNAFSDTPVTDFDQ